MAKSRADVTVLVASFEASDDARAAMVDAELAGMDADGMHLLGPTTVPAGSIERTGELSAIDDVATRSFVGGFVGAVALAVLAVIAVLLIRPEPLAGALAIAVLGGAIAGFLLGGFWSGAARLPTNPEALDTYTVDASHVGVEFRIHDGAISADDVERLCQKHHVIDIERRSA